MQRILQMKTPKTKQNKRNKKCFYKKARKIVKTRITVNENDKIKTT